MVEEYLRGLRSSGALTPAEIRPPLPLSNRRKQQLVFLDGNEGNKILEAIILAIGEAKDAILMESRIEQFCLASKNVRNSVKDAVTRQVTREVKTREKELAALKHKYRDSTAQTTLSR